MLFCVDGLFRVHVEDGVPAVLQSAAQGISGLPAPPNVTSATGTFRGPQHSTSFSLKTWGLTPRCFPRCVCFPVSPSFFLNSFSAAFGRPHGPRPPDPLSFPRPKVLSCFCLIAAGNEHGSLGNMSLFHRLLSCSLLCCESLLRYPPASARA